MSRLTEQITALAQPIVEEEGCTLWDVEYVKEAGTRYLRVYIDKENGVSIDDCVDMSHALDKPLDDADPIDRSYCLEVSSPGIERALKRDSHFEQSVGKRVILKLIRPINGEREFRGTLSGYDSGNIEFTAEDGNKMIVNKKETSYVKLDDFGGEE